MRKGKRREKGKVAGKYFIALLPLVLVIGVVVFMLTSQQSSQPLQTGTGPGRIAPDFTLNVITSSGLTPERLSLSTLRGKVVLLDFVLSWCPHCNSMEPTLKRLYNDFRPYNVEFVTIAGDDERTDEDQTAAFVARHSIPWKVVFDQRLEVFARYNVQGTPTYYVVDSDGTIVGNLVGSQTYESLAALIRRALNN
ncbi:MAG: TlpA family protein disulfide reductase [Aigarchaeota archaeon]|nr:TlpA family protein disulfide reductase [Aigarchaeota archaeon]MDW8092531.1 TlpA disulfide reductase family protein [Nitrososphaerota archaeon]